VELELALFDDAVDKFARVLQRQEESSHAIAAYGQGVALLSIAQRDLEDGKAGSALRSIQQAIDSCLDSSVNFGCTHKLLGDLYSFGASLPPNVFSQGDDPIKDSVDDCTERQLRFVSKGEDAYRSVLGVEEFAKEDEYMGLRGSSICDVAANILLQAQILTTRHERGIDYHALDVPEAIHYTHPRGAVWVVQLSRKTHFWLSMPSVVVFNSKKCFLTPIQTLGSCTHRYALSPPPKAL
jgi:hypothetical protein